MSPQQLNNMIQKIKKLPNELLVRVLQAATTELLKRSGKTLADMREELDKG